MHTQACAFGAVQFKVEDQKIHASLGGEKHFACLAHDLQIRFRCSRLCYCICICVCSARMSQSLGPGKTAVPDSTTLMSVANNSVECHPTSIPSSNIIHHYPTVRATTRTGYMVTSSNFPRWRPHEGTRCWVTSQLFSRP